MRKNRLPIVYLAFSALVASSLACNAPSPASSGDQQSPSPSVTPYVASTEPAGADKASPAPTDESGAKTQATEIPVATQTPQPTATQKPVLPTATNTPSAPTSTATLTPTATASQQAEPLTITGQGFEIADWQKLPDTDEWEGHLRITFTGGLPPYTFALENNEPQSENSLEIRWRKCVAAPLTAHVWSSDGQEAHKGIWVESPWCP